MAEQYRLPVAQLRADIEKKHGIEALTADIRNEKALAQLVAEPRDK